MLTRYKMWYSRNDEAIYAWSVLGGTQGHAADDNLYVLYNDVAPMIKRLAELEAKEQRREQFEQESA